MVQPKMASPTTLALPAIRTKIVIFCARRLRFFVDAAYQAKKAGLLFLTTVPLFPCRISFSLLHYPRLGRQRLQHLVQGELSIKIAPQDIVQLILRAVLSVVAQEQ